MAAKIPNWVWIGALAGAGYALYKFFNEAKKGVNYVEDKAAQTYLTVEDWFTGYSPALTAGSAVFPNGAQVPLKNLTVKPYGSGTNFQARVVYQGKTYQLAPHDANGNYPAVPV